MPKRILLADDSITIQKVVELTFSDGDYEVIAVNNGAKAIQKLAEMRPDIILSDIIMPEKNGYEVCEHVKSHPELRSIPVILLTGTFEPFDPDRADKAGCDAVVTKPFESQSLIHRVEELISQSQAAAPPPPTASLWPTEPEPAPQPAPAPESPFGATSPAFNPPSVQDPFAAGFQAHGDDVFGAAAPAASKSMEMPFETTPTEAFSDETRAFPRMTFDDLQKLEEFHRTPPAAPEPVAPAPPPPAESAPWDEGPSLGDETRMFPRGGQPFGPAVTEQFNPPPAPAPPLVHEPAAQETSPFGSDAPAFPVFDDLPAMPEPAPLPTHEASPLEEQAEGFGDETRAFPNMTLADLQKMMELRGAPPAPAEPEAPAPVAEPQAFSAPAPEAPPEPPPVMEPLAAAPAETQAFPSIDSTFGSAFGSTLGSAFGSALGSTEAPAAPAAQTPEAPAFEHSLWDEAPPEPAAPEPPHAEFAPPPATHLLMESAPESAMATSDSPVWEEPAAAAPVWALADSAAVAETPAAPAGAAETTSPFGGGEAEDSFPAGPAAAPAPEPVQTAPAEASPAEEPAAAAAASGVPADLTEEQITRIARRVVEMLSADVVKNIAWEVVPDMAEMVVKERIRQLESEA